MQLLSPFKVNQACRNKFCEDIISSSAPTVDFYFLIILSSLIVAMGLLVDNVVLVIGGMLVTPLLSPILSIALGIVINDHKVIYRSLRIFLSSSILTVIIGLIVGLLSDTSIGNVKLFKIMSPSLISMLVAVVAGIAASYTWAKPELNVNIAGIAITVTVMPPLAGMGLALADAEWLLFKTSLNVYLLNIIGIVLASLLVFSLMDFYKARRKIIAHVNEEEKELEKNS